jgi:hypothetical protein
VLLGAGALGKTALAPAGDEFRDVHGQAPPFRVGIILPRGAAGRKGKAGFDFLTAGAIQCPSWTWPSHGAIGPWGTR